MGHLASALGPRNDLGHSKDSGSLFTFQVPPEADEKLQQEGQRAPPARLLCCSPFATASTEMLQADCAACQVGHSCSRRNSTRGLTLGLSLQVFFLTVFHTQIPCSPGFVCIPTAGAQRRGELSHTALM